ncbi:hypothetical protein [Marivita sp.]|uniref:hypothetical protein n=1 Tax=Marivita sp. TaxID=2003365 RepID=UPI0025BD0650|nr:hypothetical protein [Marivita sp.]
MHRRLFLLTGGFLIAVGLVLLFAPQAYVSLYAVDYAAGMDFPARRFAPVVLAMGTVLVLARTHASERFLLDLSLIAAAAFLAVAATGLHAWLTGVARPTILAAAAVEALLATAFLAVWLHLRNR